MFTQDRLNCLLENLSV